MLVSELIKKLEDFKAEHGDLEVCIPWYDGNDVNENAVEIMGVLDEEETNQGHIAYIR